jgi:hypothetical protein
MALRSRTRRARAGLSAYLVRIVPYNIMAWQRTHPYCCTLSDLITLKNHLSSLGPCLAPATESPITNIHLKDVHVRKTTGKWSCEDIDTKTSGSTDVTPTLTCL